MKTTLLLCAAVMTLAGCQTPAPQSVLDSQRPPTRSIKRDYVGVLRGTIKPGDFTKAEISSVVLLDPAKQIYAFCTRTAERSNPNWSYIGIALYQNVSVDASKNDYRCRDKRLRYYNFPELLNMKS
ncbi:hypothetical protein EXN32_00335 [Agrobacterium tumefaciens]|uniref:hypothetical protein n=1 Tax=Agrobacterium TaxID=357 RepID=UPI00115DA691|nr:MULTISPECIES: hypothetical protein [Agrobacterium]MDA5241464.1 hypothetical protein [Agrobacterium sp. MAFF310724]MDA5245479.1 hypothetical protein [Agrobacterium sp. MAFF210268]NTE80645.1 hypothetical protein [Agrobacterium tumefaciens]TRB18840.1 hypothetical protein EXN32_00335 [Agrobacterium tumefaciens]WCA59359.1 hypothetical protein G6M16_002205 [Agrobacterium tumefaciens]